MYLDREIIYRRTLRTFRSISQHTRNCDQCHALILTGDEYEAEVVTIHVRFKEDGRVKKEIQTWLRHLPWCDPDDFEDDLFKEDVEEKDVVELEPLPLAA
ncbi:MAG: hypothetical protein ABIO72_05060 [Patescibacteria group bacterium]